MEIKAIVKNKLSSNEVIVSTNGQSKTLVVPSKDSGYGSAVNGGEFLMLALATCYCNDIYREAAKRKITVTDVRVEVTGKFGGEGEPGFDFIYTPTIKSDATPEQLQDLIRHTDTEIHNTLRRGASVTLKV